MKVYIVYKSYMDRDSDIIKVICATEELAKEAMEELVQKELKRYATSSFKVFNSEKAARERYYWDEVDVRTK